MAALVIIVFATLGSHFLFTSRAATLTGDLNGDGVVNIFDLSIFLSHWQQSGSGLPEDFNNDGLVNIFDLSMLLSNYGKTATAIPAHTETWAYDDGCSGGKGASSALVRQWVSYAEVHCGNWTSASPTKAISDCHSGSQVLCQVMPYVDTNLIYTGTPPDDLGANFFNTAQEGWFLHEPSPNQGTRVTTTAFGGGYLMNQNAAGFQAWWAKAMNDDFPGADGIFMDDQYPGMPLFGLSSTSSNEVTTTAGVQAMHLAISNVLKKPTGAVYPQVDNTLPDCGNPFEASGQGLSMLTGPVVGLLAEGCPTSNGSLNNFYPGLLDDMAYVNNSTSGFTVLLSYGAAGASYQQQSRRVQEATILLAYAPGKVVSWAELEQNGAGDLAVWPEEGIYPTAPIQSMGNPSGTHCFDGSGAYCPAGGHNDLQTSETGVFRREFSTCYNQGVSFGACAVIVNTTGSAVTVPQSWLSHTYAHQITLSGGDVQSGGTINLTGASFTAGSSTVASHDAMLLAP